MKILFAASEAVPYMASGGLADVAGALPKALCAAGHDCRVVLPLYGDIAPALRQQLRLVAQFQVPLAWRSQYCGVWQGQVGAVTYYLLDNEYYFKRPGLYGFYDDGERYAYFSKAVLEMLQYLDFTPDILHCNDWQTGMIPLYLNLFYRPVPCCRELRTVYTIHNIAYQGRYGTEMASDVLGIPYYAMGQVEYQGDVNLMKAGIEAADRVTTVSPTYAQELLDPWYAHGLDGLLRQRQDKLTGILNGIDTESYNPQTDPALTVHYNSRSLAGKAKNKSQLTSQMGLEEGRMLMGMVTRLASHKGLDLVQYILEEMLASTPLNLVVLGTGEYGYESFFAQMQKMHPGRVAVHLGFVPQLARQIYAGCDTFLMPSKSEPCGLSQMVAQRYGTLPIVRETGGLKDSIVDMGNPQGNGYTFQTYNAHDMLDAVRRACRDYENQTEWKKKVRRAMACDFSWDRSAQAYLALYQGLLS